MRTLYKAIHEAIVSQLSGVCCIPDDVDSYLMPLIREAILQWQEECLVHAQMGEDQP